MFDYFKLQRHSSMIFLTTIVRMCSISCQYVYAKSVITLHKQNNHSAYEKRSLLTTPSIKSLVLCKESFIITTQRM